MSIFLHNNCLLLREKCHFYNSKIHFGWTDYFATREMTLLTKSIQQSKSKTVSYVFYYSNFKNETPKVMPTTNLSHKRVIWWPLIIHDRYQHSEPFRKSWILKRCPLKKEKSGYIYRRNEIRFVISFHRDFWWGLSNPRSSSL